MLLVTNLFQSNQVAVMLKILFPVGFLQYLTGKRVATRRGLRFSMSLWLVFLIIFHQMDAKLEETASVFEFPGTQAVSLFCSVKMRHEREKLT